MKTVASKVPFEDLCKVCEKISLKSKKDEKRKVLSDFIRQWRNFHAELHKEDTNHVDSFYPALRLFLPQFDLERGAYGIKETMLAKLYIKILNLSNESEDAKKLLNYRAPKAAKAEAGDFASVAEMVLKHRCPDKGTLKVSDVNFHLDKVAFSNAEKNKEGVVTHLKKLLCHTTAQEQKWLIRMILKDIRMGLSDTSVLNIFHPDAKDLYDVTSSLSKICSQLHDPTLRLHEIEISLFTAFRPMLANRASPEKIEKTMNKKSFYLETKLDGERVQLHKNKNLYKFFSRGGIDYSHSYGESGFTGSFTPYVAKSFRGDVVTCILDGEMVGWNKHLDCMGSKGENFDVKNLSSKDETYQPCFCVFDILFYNGKVLTNLPLAERLTYLQGLFTPIEGRLMISTPKEISTKQDIIDALNEAIDKREEGIMIKDPSSVYKPNSREWIKVKPEYMDNVMSDLDLLIIGGYFGEGRRRGILSHFLLAVAVSSNNPDEPECFHSFAKVGSGYTLQELYQLLDKLKDNWQPYDKKRPPASIVLAPGHKEKPDLWIEPSKSHILQVKAAEITGSERFKTGCTLRFPRVEKVRYDKPWNQCMTVKELQELKQEADGKLVSHHYIDGEPSPKKKRTTTKVDIPKTVPLQFRPTDTSGVQQESSILSGKELCVLTSLSDSSKVELEKLIVKLGGSFVQNPGPDTFCVLSNKVTLRVKNLIQSGKYDIVHQDWLRECDRQKTFVEWTPSMMLFSTDETSKKVSVNYDEYGDSYHFKTEPEELKSIFERIPKDTVLENIVNMEKIKELESSYFENDRANSLFRCMRVYVDDKRVVGDQSTMIEDHLLGATALELRYFGAHVTNILEPSVSHVIVHTKDATRLSALEEANHARLQKFHIVSEYWVNKSVSAHKLLDEQKFFPSLDT